MNYEKIKDALEIGLNAVLSAGWTRHQETDAAEIRDAIALIESKKYTLFGQEEIKLNPKCDTCTAIACGDECDGASNFTEVPK